MQKFKDFIAMVIVALFFAAVMYGFGYIFYRIAIWNPALIIALVLTLGALWAVPHLANKDK